METLQANPNVKTQRWQRQLVVGLVDEHYVYEGSQGYTWKSELWGVVVTHADTSIRFTYPWHRITELTDTPYRMSSDEDAHVNDVDPS